MEEKNPIQVADRLFHVLELLADQGPMQLMDIAAEEELNKTTAFRVLRSLMHLGYVRQDPSDGRYSLTFRIVGLADKVREQTDMIGFLHPYLEELSGQIRETIHLVMLEESFSPDTDTEATYVDKVESPYNAVRMVSRVGGRIPLYCSGVGKALLADMSDDQIRRIWDNSDIKKITDYTITDPAELIKVIGQVREKGYALDNEENEIGVRCVAAALPPIPGRGRFAFSISAPAARMDDERIREVAGSLLRIRDRITQELRIG